MLSVVVDRPNSMAVLERPTPEPGPGEVRVRVRYAGICGSDLHIFHGKNPFVAYPRVIGHEFVGRIDAVGTGVAGERIGEWVVVDPVIAAASATPAGSGDATSAIGSRSSVSIAMAASASLPVHRWATSI